MTKVPRVLLSLLAVTPLLLTGACSIHVDKDAAGRDKTVKIDTPLGGIHVNTNEASAQNSGMPVYPGAVVVPDKEGDKAADIRLGFGDWQMRIKVVTYSTPDGQEKVLAFYRKALGGPGEVIECRGASPVGSPARTPEGLSCADTDEGSHVHGGAHADKGDLLLKSGSKRRQRLLAIENAAAQPVSGPTKFTTIVLDLPADSGKDRQTD